VTAELAARIIWLRQDGTEVPFPLTAPVTTIGRDEAADVVIDEPLVSRFHARIERRAAAFVVIDLGSTNLTRVNDDPVNEKELTSGDELRFARARCRFVIDAAPSP
jgi:pSer/pThr/pTyr-binding forkhead associated (FHA) protein